MTATYPGDTGDDARAGEPNPLVRATLALEGATALDPLVRLVAPVAEALVADRRRRDLLHGRWVGHAVHPVLVMVPLGSWASVSVLDVLGLLPGRDRAGDLQAARTLAGFGLATAVPSAVTGLAEWAATGPRDRRTGVVHALVNYVGVGLYAASYVARRRERHGRGALLAAAGLTATSVGGYLGSHLAQARKVGSHHSAYAATQ